MRRLVARSVSLPPPPPGGEREVLGTIEPRRAIAGALARCGTREAEITLRAWLRGPSEQAELSAIGLGQLAFRRGRLDDASLVALLDGAANPETPVKNALLAFAHLEGLGPSVRERLIAVAAPTLKTQDVRRSLAIRALGQAGSVGARSLGRVLVDESIPASDRAEAARQLVRLGADGQTALGETVGQLIPSSTDLKTLSSPGWAPLAATLEGLAEPVPAARDALVQLAELPIGDQVRPAQRRRLVWLRCAAAAILAGEATRSQRLVACDPDPQGRIGALAALRVLDRGTIKGARHRRWIELANASDASVAEAALALMVRHPEIPNPHLQLVKALDSRRTGVVAAAAKILAALPDRAAEASPDDRSHAERSSLETLAAPKPDPAVVAALGRAFTMPQVKSTFEPRLSLLDAAGALALLNLKPQLEADCASDQLAPRIHAERALRRLGNRRRSCSGPTSKGPARPMSPPTVGGFEVLLVTDAGQLRLTLDAAQAPFAVARVVELARAGFYNGTMVHRVVPGFVVQLGDPGGDGYGGSEKGPLPCETGPIPFEALAVGMALTGRDTGSSQFFVTLGSYPHLEGDFTRIGTASGDWDRAVVGDLIERVEVRPVVAP
ncbi:MAG: peptidylprolyl isomerase [Polyangiaceae bacterium]|nr:peptidylprolyl isomerase [Polyangiaceae bacterium]